MHVLLNSGGMDSFFVPRYTGQDITHHVFVDIGQNYVDKERAAAQRIASFYGTELVQIHGAQIAKFEHKSGIIPLRNAELLLCAGQFGENLYMGILANEVNSDKSPEFLRTMEAMMTISCRPQYWSDGKSFRIHTPLGTRSKATLVRDLWRRVGEDDTAPAWETMLDTVSCYSGTAGHCGRCPSCFKRWVALTVGTAYDGYGVDMFDKHPATWYPLAHWRAQNYPIARMSEIAQAYELAHVRV
jgi:7-cyano-7-deazaguanine synthase in queuosine biosynthesis